MESSIFEACRYFELFQKTMFKNKCAVVDLGLEQLLCLILVGLGLGFARLRVDVFQQRSVGVVEELLFVFRMRS